MNAHQRLWKRLATMIPVEHYEWLLEQHREDLARDRRHSQYRTWQRREREALSALHGYDRIDYPGLLDRAREKYERAAAWLAKHADWNPDTRTGECTEHSPAADSTDDPGKPTTA
ncbi:MAG: hypothetical protein HGA65_03455 [Oscillochloris sp.]|nr:hypothetical protein [Oscillochloris sp.]